MSLTTAWPIAIRAVDLAQPLQPISGLSRYSRLRVFVHDRDTLIGSADLWNGGADVVSAERLAAAISTCSSGC